MGLDDDALALEDDIGRDGLFRLLALAYGLSEAYPLTRLVRVLAVEV